jgi:hypothetical protein
MSHLTLTLPILNQPDSTEDPKIINAFTAIQTWANGNVDWSNFPTPPPVDATVRGFGTIYTPNSSRPTFVTASVQVVGTAGAPGLTYMLVNGAVVGRVAVYAAITMYGQIAGMVPIGGNYQLVNANDPAPGNAVIDTTWTVL